MNGENQTLREIIEAIPSEHKEVRTGEKRRKFGDCQEPVGLIPLQEVVFKWK